MFHHDWLFDRLQREMGQVLRNLHHSPEWSDEYPPLALSANEDEVEVRALVPGIEPEKIDLSIVNETLTIRGEHPIEELPEKNAQYLRRERLTGSFVRTLQLPFRVDAEKIKARCVHGVLTVTLKRAEKDRPRKIAVSA
jgi:HSP20 family protein